MGRTQNAGNEEVATHVHRCPPALTCATAKDLLRAFHHLAKSVARPHSDESPAPRVVFDLTPCADIDVGALLLILYHARKLRDLGWDTYVGGEGPPSQMVLEHVRHYKLPRELRRLTQTASGNYLLRGISDAKQMVKELEDWAESVRAGTSARPDDVALWQTQIAEVTMNAFQHGPTAKTLAENETGIVVAGRAAPDSATVQLAALDFGSGIPALIERAAPPTDIPDAGDGDLILHACRKGVTSRCVPQNQGAGLYTLLKMVREVPSATLQILSRNGLFHVSRGRQFRRNLIGRTAPHFDGTLTVITLPTTLGAPP